MASQTLLRLPLRNCRDLLLARQRARQIAQILRFPAADATAIASKTFLIAAASACHGKVAVLVVSLQEGHLRIEIDCRKGWTAPPPLIQALPADESRLANDDILFVLAQMDGLTPPTPLAELVRLHEEMLGLLARLRDRQEDASADHPSAA